MRELRRDPPSARRHRALAGCVAAACLLTAASGLAVEPPSTGTGSDPGAITGRVFVAGGGSDHTLPGVELRLDDGEPATSDPSTLSGPDGRYQFPELEPRRYLIKVASSGFEPYQQPIAVPAGTDVQHDVPLEAAFSGSVTVTATRSERRTEEVPAAVSVVGREQLEQTPMTNIKDALEGMPSTLIGAKNQGYDARLVIRGAGLKARYGIREIMVLLNGVPITDPDSFTRLDFVDTQLVDRVEVVRGPNSTLWGINATGGTVNVITRSPSTTWGGSATADVGSFGASALQLNYSGGLADKHFFSVDVSRRQGDNDWRPHNEFDTTQVTVQPWINLGGDTMLETYISYTDANLQLPGWLIVDDAIDQWTPFLDTGEAEETAEPWKAQRPKLRHPLPLLAAASPCWRHPLRAAPVRQHLEPLPPRHRQDQRGRHGGRRHRRAGHLGPRHRLAHRWDHRPLGSPGQRGLHLRRRHHDPVRQDPVDRLGPAR